MQFVANGWAQYLKARFSQFPGDWVVSVLCTLLFLYARAPQTFLEPQFWAEDGTEFFVGQKLLGVKALFRPSSGYYHLVPRVTAFLASPLPAAEAPALYAAASILVTLWSAATIASTPIPYSWVLGAMLMLPPHSGEVFGTITNAQWLMAPALALIVLAPAPPSLAGRRNQIAFAMAAALSGPFSVLILPLVGWRLWHERNDTHARLVCCIVLVSAVIQGLSMLGSYHGDKPITEPLHLAMVLTDRWIGQLANGDLTHTLAQALADAVVIFGALSIFTERTPVTIGMGAFALALLGSTWVKFLRMSPDSFDYVPNGDRYLYGPRLLVLWALVIVLLRLRPASLIAAVSIGIIVVHFSSWSKAPVPILPWRSEAWRIDRGEAVRIQINPQSGSDEESWTVTLPAMP